MKKEIRMKLNDIIKFFYVMLQSNHLLTGEIFNNNNNYSLFNYEII